MKYYFKKYLNIPCFAIEKKNGTSVGLINIGKLHDISYTNQRAYFNTKTELEWEGYKSMDIFSIEWWNPWPFPFFWTWYQRRTQDERLKKIAKYLIDGNDDIDFFADISDKRNFIKNLWKSSFFPNNIIVSFNNELWNETNMHDLFVDASQVNSTEDYDDFMAYLKSYDDSNIVDEGNHILFDEKVLELCRVEEWFLKLPIFELSDNIEEDEVKDFILNSALYSSFPLNEETIRKVKANEQHYKLAWIIDWQHRTFSLRFLREQIDKLKYELSKKIKEQKLEINLEELFNSNEIYNSICNTQVIITGFLKSTINEQAKIFIDVNNNVKPVDKSLTYDLLPLTEKAYSIELACKKIFDELNQDQASPLYNYLFNIRWQAKKSLISLQILSQANFINELKFYLKSTKNSDRIFNDLFEKKNITAIYWLIYSFFSKVNEHFNPEIINEDGMYKDKEYALYRTTGFWVLLQIMTSILKQEDINVHMKAFDKVQFQNSKNPINIIFNEKIKIIKNKINFSRTSISSFRWKWGQDDLANAIKILIWLDSSENKDDEKKQKLEKNINQIVIQSEIENNSIS